MINDVEMSDELAKEYEILCDLEFEYNVLNNFSDDEAQKIIALGKVKKQISKIKKMEKEEAKNESMDIKAQEEQSVSENS